MPCTTWPVRRHDATEPGGGAHQQPAAAQLPAELAGQGVRHPEPAQVAEQGQGAEAEGEADQQLQAELEHGAVPDPPEG